MGFLRVFFEEVLRSFMGEEGGRFYEVVGRGEGA